MTRRERNELFYRRLNGRFIALIAAPIMFPIFVYCEFLDSETGVSTLQAWKTAFADSWKLFIAYMKDPLS